MNTIRIASESLWPAESVTVRVTTQTPLTKPTTPRQLMEPKASRVYTCAISVGGAVLQLPLADVPSPKSSDQLAMSPSGSLLPIPRRLKVQGHDDVKAPQPQPKKIRLPLLAEISLALVQTDRGLDCWQTRVSPDEPPQEKS